MFIFCPTPILALLFIKMKHRKNALDRVLCPAECTAFVLLPLDLYLTYNLPNSNQNVIFTSKLHFQREKSNFCDQFPISDFYFSTVQTTHVYQVCATHPPPPFLF